jgi:hypothetical protein
MRCGARADVVVHYNGDAISSPENAARIDGFYGAISTEVLPRRLLMPDTSHLNIEDAPFRNSLLKRKEVDQQCVSRCRV